MAHFAFILPAAATNTREKATQAYSCIVLCLLKALSWGIGFTSSPARSDSIIMENVSHYFAYLQGILEGLLKFQLFLSNKQRYFKVVLTVRSVWSTYAAPQESPHAEQCI